MTCPEDEPLIFSPEDNPEAVRAMGEIGDLQLDPEQPIGPQISYVMDDHGVDSSAQVDVIQRIEALQDSENPPSPAELQAFTREAVGRAVADPRVAGNRAEEAVLDDGVGLSADELREHAAQAAGAEAKRAGASSEDAEALAKQYMNQGMSPAMAAKAAATVTAARQLGFPEGLEIFGHLIARVSGLVIETNRSTENKTVTNETKWLIDDALVQTSSEKFTVNCTNYHAIAKYDVSVSPWAMNIYSGGYEMTSPHPLTLTGFSLGAALSTNSAYVTSTTGAGYRFSWPMAGDFYATLAATSMGFAAKGPTDRQFATASLLDVQVSGLAVYSSSGKTVALEASNAQFALQKAKSLGIVLAAASVVSVGGALIDGFGRH